MGEESVQLDISEQNNFLVDVSFEDGWEVGEPDTIECVVDTGCTTALALPEGYESKFEKSIGTVIIRGAGRGESEQYPVKINKVGEHKLNHTSACTCSLPSHYNIGLLGMEFLIHTNVCIQGVPDNKKMSIDLEHTDVQV